MSSRKTRATQPTEAALFQLCNDLRWLPFAGQTLSQQLVTTDSFIASEIDHGLYRVIMNRAR